MRKLVLLSILLCLSPVLADLGLSEAKNERSECSTTLVGVMETVNGFEGIFANLTVSVAPGNGNVWVDTMPLTKVETQISARLARDVACELLDVDCSNLDFFYLMRSDHVLVGGPSAGAPMTVCTMALLLNQSLCLDVVMTGTINPDGGVGPVGGVLDKALILDDYTYFLIPEGSLVEVDGLSVELVEVRDVLEAFKYFTGYEIVFGNVSSEELVNADFISAMKLMDEALITIAGNELSGVEAESLLNDSQDLYDNGSYYSSASYSVRSLIYSFFDQNAYLVNDSIMVSQLIDNVSSSISYFREEFLSGLEINHLYDLESFAITMDRISEAESLVSDAREANDSSDALFLQSFAMARLITAKQWSTLLDYFADSGEINFDVNTLRPLIIERLEGARNSVAYAQTVVGSAYLSGAEEHLINAVVAYNNDELVYSLFESLKARAEANLMMELRGFDNVTSRIDFKRDSAVRAISNSMQRGYLPLLSLSFLEYSESFDDTYQELVFLAYSKEFASLGLLLNEYSNYHNIDYSVSYTVRRVFDNDIINFVLLMVLGITIGLVLTLSLLELNL